jgi:arginase
VTVIRVPYHQDERLPDDDIPAPAGVVVSPALPAGGIWPRLTSLYSAVAGEVAASAGTPVVYSGDCLVAGATVAGVQRSGPDPAVVWFDAHGDLHTLDTTTSGYLGGLSLRLLTGAHAGLYADPIGLRPVPPERAVLVGARDLDPAETDYLATGAIRRLAVDEVSAGTVPPGPLVVHADLDVLDPAEVPGLLVPAAGGVTMDALLEAFARILSTGRVVAWDIACTWHRATGPAERDDRMRLLYRLAPYLR